MYTVATHDDHKTVSTPLPRNRFVTCGSQRYVFVTSLHLLHAFF